MGDLKLASADIQRRPSDEGKNRLSTLIEDCRDRANITDWGDFAEWLSANTGIFITKDLVYKTVKGNYQTEPSMRVVYALVQAKEFQFRKNKIPATMEAIAELLYDRRDIYGQPLKSENSTNSDN